MGFFFVVKVVLPLALTDMKGGLNAHTESENLFRS